MGALAQGPAVAKGKDFVVTKLATRKVASHAPAPSTITCAPSTISSAPSTITCAPNVPTVTAQTSTSASLTPTTSAYSISKQPLRALKLTPLQFAEIKKVKLERDAAGKKAPNKVSQAPKIVSQSPKMVSQPPNIVSQAPNMVSQAPNMVSQAPSMAFQPQTNFMNPFHFSPFMPMPLPMPGQSFPMSLVNNGQPGTINSEASSTMMWQAMYGAMTSEKK